MSADFIDILKQVREQRGLDVESFSISLGLPKYVIKDWEARKRRPRVSSAVRWAAALGLDLQITVVPKITNRSTLTLKQA